MEDARDKPVVVLIAALASTGAILALVGLFSNRNEPEVVVWLNIYGLLAALVSAGLLTGVMRRRATAEAKRASELRHLMFASIRLRARLVALASASGALEKEVVAHVSAELLPQAEDLLKRLVEAGGREEVDDLALAIERLVAKAFLRTES